MGKAASCCAAGQTENRRRKRTATQPDARLMASFEGLEIHEDVLFSNTFESWEAVPTVLVVPAGITRIGRGAFACSSSEPRGFFCNRITALELPRSLRTIESRAFAFCNGLAGTLTIMDGTTEIGSGAFQHCRNLKALELPSSLRTIGDDAFASCTSLESVAFKPPQAEMLALLLCQLKCHRAAEGHAATPTGSFVLALALIGRRISRSTTRARVAFSLALQPTADRRRVAAFVASESQLVVSATAFSGCPSVAQAMVAQQQERAARRAFTVGARVSVCLDAPDRRGKTNRARWSTGTVAARAWSVSSRL